MGQSLARLAWAGRIPGGVLLACSVDTRQVDTAEPTGSASGGTPGTTQYWAKANPGLRQLEVLKGFGDQTTNAIVASICARNTSDPSRPDFGYRPAMAAIIERLQPLLATP